MLHLHGTLSVNVSEFEVRRDQATSFGLLHERERPRYSFDPDSITSNFLGYDRTVEQGYEPIDRRVVAPVPQKSAQMQRPFINVSYARAASLVRQFGNLVAIGYSFNRLDRVSYGPILDALSASSHPASSVITPEADTVVARLKTEYPGVEIDPTPDTFRSWAMRSLSG